MENPAILKSKMSRSEHEIRKRKLLLLLIIPIFCVPIALTRLYAKLGYYHVPPFHGKVIDFDTGNVIEGAVVLTVYYQIAHTIAGSKTYPFDVQETLTDVKGVFKIPDKSGQLDQMIGSVSTGITIFKPGYGVFPNHESSIAVGVNKAFLPPEKFIVYELPKLNTAAERKSNLNFEKHLDITLDKAPNFIRLINQERMNLGLQPYRLKE